MILSAPQFIAEVKIQSPYGFKSDRSWMSLLELAAEHGDMVSIHVEPTFGGSPELLSLASSRFNVPLLAKGYHRTNEDVRRSFDMGATTVLVVDRMPPHHIYGKAAFMVEVHHLDDLEKYDEFYMVWNQRSLMTGEKRKYPTIQAVRAAFQGPLCQASFIETPADVCEGVQSFIVGEHLPGFIEARQQQ